MKKLITSVFLLLCALCAFAQGVHLDLRNVTVRRAIAELKQQTEYSFVFEASDLNLNRRVDVKAESLDDAVKQILAGQGVNYKVQGKSIVVYKDTPKTQGGKAVVRGTVSDSNGDPLPGVTVVEAATTNGVITDVNGNFVITVNADAALEVSCLGFETATVRTGGNAPLSIKLRDDISSLEGAVLIGYGTSKKKELTGAIASVKASELNTVSSASVNQMLQGKVSGMSSVQSSAQPGAGASVVIRGAASPNGSNAPLYVIDGVPMQTFSTADPGISTTGYELMSGVDRDPLNTINPNDIESIEVLKDASAAIYGASAANGVILITTKSGRAGKPKVEFRSVWTAMAPKPYPQVLNARQFREQANLWTKEYYLYEKKMGVYGDNPVDLSGYFPVFNDVNGYTAETNWMKEVSQRAHVIDQNLTVNGGNDYTKYFFSYNFYDNKGLLKQSGLQRHNIRLNLDQKFSERVDAGIRFNYSNVTANSTSVGDHGNGDNMVMRALDFAPDIPVRDENGNYSKSYNQLHNNPVSYTDIEDKTVTDRIFIAPTLDIKIADGLVLKAVGGYDQQITTRSFYLPVSMGNATVPEGMASLSAAKVMNLSGETFFNYDKTFGGIHHLTAVLGVGYYKTSTESFGLTADDFFTDAFGYNNVGIASGKDKEAVRSSKAERTKLSQFVRVNYALLDKYIFSATVRRDGSSYFAPNHKWGVFPSASFAWRVNQEDFMKGLNGISDLKLRLSYGATGNENVLSGNSLAFYKSGYDFLIGSSMRTGLMLTQVENPNLKWETDYMFNVGLDYGFFNQRISGSVEYFHRGVKDLIDFQKLPSNNAVSRVAANIGETKSEGFEFSLKSDNIKSYDFRWETTLNVTYTKASWVKRNPEVALAEYIGEQDPLDQIYGWETAGIITDLSEKPSWMPDANIGNVIYVDQNGDGVLDIKDVVKLGNRTPRWMIGLGNTFSYKGFDLNFYFYCATGYKKGMGQLPSADRIGNHGTAPGNTYASIMTDVWNSQTGTGWMPGVASNPYSGKNPSGSNDFYLMSGAYVKLKNITLGYSLPDKLFSAGKFIQGARFFLDAQNVWTITNYKGFDPELATGNPYPQAVSVSLGFNLNF